MQYERLTRYLYHSIEKPMQVSITKHHAGIGQRKAMQMNRWPGVIKRAPASQAVPPSSAWQALARVDAE